MYVQMLLDLGYQRKLETELKSLDFKQMFNNMTIKNSTDT